MADPSYIQVLPICRLFSLDEVVLCPVLSCLGVLETLGALTFLYLVVVLSCF